MNVPHKLHTKILFSINHYRKGAGVFSSHREISASSRKIQFHWALCWDSRAMIASFMHVKNYLTRNFATLWLSWLQPPFIERWLKCVNTSSWVFNTGQISDLIRHLSILQSLVFLLNSSRSLFTVTLISLWNKAPFIPKLQGYFAEFLNINSLKRLSKMYQSTRVGLEYGLLSVSFLEHIVLT